MVLARCPRLVFFLCHALRVNFLALFSPSRTCRERVEENIRGPSASVRMTEWEKHLGIWTLSRRSTTRVGLSLSGELCVTSDGRRSVRRDSSLQELSLRMTPAAARFFSSS